MAEWERVGSCAASGVDAARATPELGVLLVDWDSATWREPLTGEPASPADLYRAIAYRLAQVRGVAAADPYWLAEARVEAAAENHRALERDFDASLMRACLGERIENVLFDQLRANHLIESDGKVRTTALEKWRSDSNRRSLMAFEAWARNAGLRPLGSDPQAAISPNRVLENGLRAALCAESAKAPLLLVLDTCEVLTEDLDRALRFLVIGLVRDRARVLVLIGSRLAPDVSQPPSSREGWRAELQRIFLREVPFSETVCFTVEEVEAALERLDSARTDTRRSPPNGYVSSLMAFP